MTSSFIPFISGFAIGGLLGTFATVVLYTLFKDKPPTNKRRSPID